MNTPTVRTRFALVLAQLVFALFAATSSALACIVGTGTSASCTEAALNACLPGGGGFDGTVTFACGGAATITVTSTKIISADTTIDGGSVVTISGGGTVMVFIVAGAGVTLALDNVTISGGNSLGAGGAIFNSRATLTVTNSTFSGNNAASVGDGGAIFNNGGTVTVTNSTFSGNSASRTGGAIFNTSGGTLTVTNSTFSNNSAAADSGAIRNDGTLTVTNSTFSNNSAATDGGAILDNSGTSTVTNSTFTGDNAGHDGGAIFNNSGSPTVTNSTFSGNSAATDGGAIFNGSTLTVTVTNSILANSTSGGNCSVSDRGGPITDGGHNIDDGGTCGFTGTNCATTTGTSFCKTDPLLDPAGLANNGGPTQTIALEAGSPAINAANETVCAAPPVNNLDQRGFVRPGVGATNCSIGAYEFNSARCGDVNGDGVVNIGDALVVAQFDVGLRQCGVAPFSHPEVCDVNRDGACNIGDALRMAQCDVGLISCAFTCTPFVCH